jgi:uncharacterized protein
MKLLQTSFYFLISCFILILLMSTACSPDTDFESTPEVLIVGGHEHHDFDRWFREADSTTIAETGALVNYTDDPDAILPQLSSLDILYLGNNQPLPDRRLQRAIHDFVREGNGLLLVHPSLWYNWQDDWPEYYRDFVGGGTYSHPPLGEFEVFLVDEEHPLAEGVPSQFSIVDELYRFERDEEGTDIHVIAKGIEEETGEEYPVVWTSGYGEGRIVSITLGHDGDSHEHEAYKTLLRNSIEWLNN